MLEEKIKAIGFNDKEAKIYLALLELGEATIQDIVKKSGVKRTTSYDVLDSLLEKGYISQTKNRQKTLYFAENPQKLERSLDEKKAALQGIMPELLSITNLLEKKPAIKYFEGVDGMKSIYKDHLSYPDQMMLSWWPKDFKIIDVDYYYSFFMPQRLEKKIAVRVIAPDNALMQKTKLEDQKFLRQTRLIGSPAFNTEVEITLYGKNKISLLSFEEKFGLIIESQRIFNTLKSIFEVSWESLSEK